MGGKMGRFTVGVHRQRFHRYAIMHSHLDGFISLEVVKFCMHFMFVIGKYNRDDDNGDNDDIDDKRKTRN